MIDVLTGAYLLSALGALVVTGLMAAGFVRLAFRGRGLVGHMAIGIVTVHSAVFLRTLYRDLAPLVFDESSVLFSRGAFLVVALALNGLIAIAGWHGLKALYLAIPEQARGRYSLLTAAMYPPFRSR